MLFKESITFSVGKTTIQRSCVGVVCPLYIDLSFGLVISNNLGLLCESIVSVMKNFLKPGTVFS